jgi:hypothetical protein
VIFVLFRLRWVLFSEKCVSTPPEQQHRAQSLSSADRQQQKQQTSSWEKGRRLSFYSKKQKQKIFVEVETGMFFHF